MSFIFALFFAGGLGLFSVFFGILASSLFELLDDTSGNLMPTIIGISWLAIPLYYIFGESGNQMINTTIGVGGLIGFGVGVIFGLTRN